MLLAEGLDKRFKNVADAEQALAIPFLGFVPRHALPKRRPPALITLQKPWSAAAEAYHTVRTWIQLAQPPVRSLLVTSARSREGKSTTAANLAVSFAQLGRHVLLVDADLRHPSLHRVFGDVQGQGLTTCWRVGWSGTVSCTRRRWTISKSFSRCLSFKSHGIVKHGTAEAPYRALEGTF